MSITIRIDTKSATKGLSVLELTQLPFATSLAVNRTGLDFQKAERERLARQFTLRRADFINKQGVKRLGPAATKRNPSITLGVDPKASFLDKFELGQTKRPRSGSNLAIPVDIKRNKRDIITRANRPRALITRLAGKTGAGSVFVLKRKQGRLPAGVFQRTGRKGQALKLLYAFAPQVRTPKILGFVETFKHTVDTRWKANFSTALSDALKTAK